MRKRCPTHPVPHCGTIYRLVEQRATMYHIASWFVKVFSRAEFLPARMSLKGSNMSVHSLFDLMGQVAIITGGATGLGRQMALALAESGADVIIASRNIDRSAQFVEELRGLGGKPLAYQLDVSKPAAPQAMVDAILAEYGRIDILVNNSAATDINRPYEPLNVERWDAVLRVNLTGVMVCANAVLGPMKTQGRGKIINIASVYGMVGVDTRLYGATAERP